MTRGPDPIDVHVGSRVRQRRKMLGLSQTQLANELGLTFQQVQKYERGTNRIGSSKLWRISKTLDVPVNYFFEGLPDNKFANMSKDQKVRALVSKLSLIVNEAA